MQELCSVLYPMKSPRDQIGGIILILSPCVTSEYTWSRGQKSFRVAYNHFASYFIGPTCHMTGLRSNAKEMVNVEFQRDYLANINFFIHVFLIKYSFIYYVSVHFFSFTYSIQSSISNRSNLNTISSLYLAQIPEFLHAIIISTTFLAVTLSLKNYELEEKFPSLHKLSIFKNKIISAINSPIIKEAKKDPQQSEDCSISETPLSAHCEQALQSSVGEYSLLMIPPNGKLDFLSRFLSYEF